MERIQYILQNKLWQYCIKQNQFFEENREFCRHDVSHLLDVARIAYIYVLTNHIQISQELVYAAALLHDIGRWQQYQFGIPHNEASAAFAQEILHDSCFTEQEINSVVSAILCHRNEQILDKDLNYILYYADKKSRNCFLCNAKENCNWSDSKKNRTLDI